MWRYKAALLGLLHAGGGLPTRWQIDGDLKGFIAKRVGIHKHRGRIQKRMLGIHMTGAVVEAVGIHTVAHHHITGTRIGSADPPRRGRSLLKGQHVAIAITDLHARHRAHKVQHQIKTRSPDGQVKIQRVAGHVAEARLDSDLLHGALRQVDLIAGFSGVNGPAQAEQDQRKQSRRQGMGGRSGICLFKVHKLSSEDAEG